MVTQVDSQAVDALNVALEKVAEILANEDGGEAFAHYGWDDSGCDKSYYRKHARSVFEQFLGVLEKMELPASAIEAANDASVPLFGNAFDVFTGQFRAIIKDLRRLSLKGGMKSHG